MASPIEVKVPDIGDFKDIPIIEVLVHPGDAIKPEDPLVTLESDKATMDVPAPTAGVVKDIKVKVGDKVSKGSLVLTLDPGEQTQTAAAPAATEAKAPAGEKAPAAGAKAPTDAQKAAPAPETPSTEPTAKREPRDERGAETREVPAPAPVKPPTEAPALDEAAFALAHPCPAGRRPWRSGWRRSSAVRSGRA